MFLLYDNIQFAPITQPELKFCNSFFLSAVMEKHHSSLSLQ